MFVDYYMVDMVFITVMNVLILMRSIVYSFDPVVAVRRGFDANDCDNVGDALGLPEFLVK
ncbi:399_t:CDS:2 [Funneliformis mosseae]|uniref:399_t:CDS:1 n=1 Tax=Funneliformis mosseae TaxID=27381 RepID=A0A9N9AJ10_FUNMO|nr:399_t:CDS:2 [Funneliformis mosseae]